LRRALYLVKHHQFVAMGLEVHGGVGQFPIRGDGDTVMSWNGLVACPEGLEPPTCCLEGNCSIQLSYGQQGPRWADTVGRGGGIRTRDLLLPKQLRYQAALHPE
jgi:hypothetical protein